MKHSLTILMLSVFLFACSSTTKQQEEKNQQQVAQKNADVNKLVGLASVEPETRIVSLYSDVSGIVKKINYDVNSEVKAGDVILVLNSDVEEAQLLQAKSKVATQEAMIKAAQAQLASSTVKMDNAEVNYNRNEKLMEAGAVTKQTTDDSRFTYESSEKDVSAADATLIQQKAKITELQADIVYYEELIERKKIKAPATGKILSLDVKIGSNVSPSQSIGDFAPDGPLIAVTEVDELFAYKVQKGMKAYIRPQGQSDTLAIGTVYLTSPYLRKKTLFSDDATNMEDRRVREVRVLLDKSDKVLIGSRVECVIQLK